MNLTPPPPTTQSFAESAIPLSLIIKPSRLYLAAIFLFHLLALAASTIAVVPAPVRGMLWLSLIVSLICNITLSSQTRRIVWHAENRWTIKNQKHQTYDEAKLRSADFLSRWLVILTLKPENRRAERFVIPFDSVEKDSYRLLRVRLRIEGHHLINPTDPSKTN